MRLLSILLYLPVLTTLAAPPSTSSGDSSDTAEETDTRNFKELNLDPHGFIHVAGDGIARSYDADGNVIDHHVLTNEQLLGHIRDTFDHRFKEGERLLEYYAHIDGHNVPENERVDPPNHIKPERFRENGQDQSPNPAHEVESNLLDKRTNGPRCLGKHCFDTDACRVQGCYACIQTENQWREKKCIIRPYWYDRPFPLVQSGPWCGRKGKGRRSWLCARS